MKQHSTSIPIVCEHNPTSLFWRVSAQYLGQVTRLLVNSKRRAGWEEFCQC